MKKSKAETALTRKRIVEVASQAFKTNGIQATGVAEIMQSAGLTHGAFYRHFESKEQLVAEACGAGMDVLVESARAAAESDAAFRKHVESVLSAEYRDDCLGGCPLTAMGSELVRADPETRKIVSEGYKELISALSKRGPHQGTKTAEADAVFTLCSMVGAITMSRIVDDPRSSAQILDVARRRLVNPVKARSPTKALDAGETKRA
jgi:TetR/AcrR family transcriptional repressor of nem operon